MRKISVSARTQRWAAGLAIVVASALAASSVQAQQRGPLVLAKSSYFFIGGKIDPAVEGSPTVGQMYVEYMIPQRQTHRYPIVMVHGGSQTGTNFTGTPDGREGWAHYFVRRGYAVYVVDQVARGRAANWSQAQGPVQPANVERLTQRFGAPDWFADNPREKAYGLGEVPITYDPPFGANGKLEFVRQDKADGPDLARCWLQKEPARKLPNIAKVPMLIVASEASYHAGYDHCTSAYLNQAGVKHSFVRLGERGIHGNGHMMMLEKNNQAIARLMADWVERA